MDQCDDCEVCVSSAASKHVPAGDGAAEPAYDRIVELVSEVFDAPITAVILTVDGRPSCRASVGFPDIERLENSLIYKGIVDGGKALILEDASADDRFEDDFATASSPPIRFCAGVPIEALDGAPIGALIIADIQARQALSAIEVDRLRSFAALVNDVLTLGSAGGRQDQRSAENSTILASVSHDLRTPMSGVLGMAELLLTADDLGDRHRRRVETIKRSGQTLLTMLDRLTELSKVDSEAHELKAAEADLPSGPRDQTNAVRDVLVAEDDPDMALLIEDLLDEAGYRATVAFDGASALEFIDQKPFDVVLMDGRLPDMTGFEAADAIRNLPDERANIPIIALTGEALPGDRERYLSAGMDDYIAKPVSYATLVGTIERCYGEAR